MIVTKKEIIKANAVLEILLLSAFKNIKPFLELESLDVRLKHKLFLHYQSCFTINPMASSFV